MSSNSRRRKQTKANTNNSVPRTSSFAIEPTPGVSPFLFPGQAHSAPSYNMFSNYSTSSLPPGLSMADIPQSNKTPPVSAGSYYSPTSSSQPDARLQTSSQPQKQPQQPQLQNNQQKSGGVSDVEKLRQLKQAILAGQHPVFRAVPRPDVLANLWLGPHPASQSPQERYAENKPGSLSLSQSEAKGVITSEKAGVVSQPVSVITSTAESNTTTIGSMTTSSAVPSGSSATSPTQQRFSCPNGAIDPSHPESATTRPSIVIPPKPQDSAVPNNATPLTASQAHTRSSLPSLTSGATGTTPDRSLPPSLIPSREASELNKGPPVGYDPKDSASYRPPGGYDRDRDHERAGYPYEARYDSARYPYPPDRRDSSRDPPRHAPRHGDQRYDRNREWNRDREWEDRDRERDRDRPREKADSDRPSRPPPQSLPPASDSQHVPLDQLPVPGLRSGVPPHPEQRPPSRPEPHPYETLSSVEQRRPDLPRRPDSDSAYPDHNAAVSSRPDAPYRPEPHRSHPDTSAPRSPQPSISQSQPPISGGDRPPAPPTGQPPQPSVTVPPDRPSTTGAETHPIPRPAPPQTTTEQITRPSGSESTVPRPPPLEASAKASQSEDHPPRHDDDGPRPYYPSSTSSRPLAPPTPPTISPRRPTNLPYDSPQDRRSSSSSYREPGQPGPGRSYPGEPGRPPSDPGIPRRPESYYPPPPPHGPPGTSLEVDRREEIRQWREREGYGPFPRPDDRRYGETREWCGDTYGRDRDPRDIDIDVHPVRGRPPPASWDRERPDYEAGAWDRDRKYPPGPPPPPPPRSGRMDGPSRWEDPHRPPIGPPVYDDRFIPRDAAAARYPPGPDAPFRENPRVRQRSPSPTVRPPGGYDESHRAPKRVRDEYERPPPAPTPPPFYDRPDFAPRVPSPAYYDPRAAGLANPRGPSPYRDRGPDPYRRDMPPPRSPGPFYPGRDRYPPPR